ncbi:MAG: helix-turn-helix transcriptional regulator [candidate division WOR-3 bacterium]
MALARDIFAQLRSLRLKANLTQEQVAGALGLKGKNRRSFICQLERGDIANPSLKLILDYLRACRATPEDLKNIFAKYLSEPLPVPEKKGRGPRPKEKDLQVERMRQAAAMVGLIQKLEMAIHNELNRLKVAPFSSVRRNAVRFCRGLLRILVQEEEGQGTSLEKRVERLKKRQREKGVPEELLEHLQGVVAQVFIGLKKAGELDRLPTIEEAERVLARPARKRVVSDEWLCRYEMQQERLKELKEFERRSAPIIAGALRFLSQQGVSDSDLANYRGFINSFLNLARLYPSDSEERRKRVEYNLKTCARPKHNLALLRHLARFIFEKWDGEKHFAG